MDKLNKKIEKIGFQKSLQYAIRGLRYVLRNERNFRIELVFALAVLMFSMVLRIEKWELIIIILLTVLVIITELTNTIVERVVDILEPRIHPFAKLIKDIMAAIVLISAMVSVAVGLMILMPYVFNLLIQCFYVW